MPSVDSGSGVTRASIASPPVMVCQSGIILVVQHCSAPVMRFPAAFDGRAPLRGPHPPLSLRARVPTASAERPSRAGGAALQQCMDIVQPEHITRLSVNIIALLWGRIQVVTPKRPCEGPGGRVVRHVPRSTSPPVGPGIQHRNLVRRLHFLFPVVGRLSFYRGGVPNPRPNQFTLLSAKPLSQPGRYLVRRSADRPRRARWLTYEKSSDHRPVGFRAQRFRRLRMPRNVANAPVSSETHRNRRQEQVLNGATSGGAVFLGHFLAVSWHAVDVHQRRSVRHPLAAALSWSTASALIVVGQLRNLGPFLTTLVQDKEPPWVRESLVRSPHGGVHHPL